MASTQIEEYFMVSMEACTRFQNLLKRGFSEERAAMSAFNQRGAWFNSGTSHMNQAIMIEEFIKLGLFNLAENC